MPTPVHRLFRRLQRSLRTRGFRGSLQHAIELARNALRSDPKREATGDEDTEFDRRFGVDTSGVIPQADLDVDSETWVHGSAYVATDSIDLGEVLSPFALDYGTTSFVDLGCGKGRVLMLAWALPFARIIGVEYSPTLAAIARRNLSRYSGPRGSAPVTVETADASRWIPPSGDLLLFMYHPFDAVVMQQVIGNLSAALSGAPRRVMVLYLKPVHADLWEASPHVQVRYRCPRYTVFELRG